MSLFGVRHVWAAANDGSAVRSRDGHLHNELRRTGSVTIDKRPGEGPGAANRATLATSGPALTPRGVVATIAAPRNPGLPASPMER